MDYKDDKYHDPMLNEDIALALNLASREELAKLRTIALNVNDVLKRYFAGLGILIPDFKLEFGRHKSGILVADEISPDTCRFWDKNTKKSFDKDVFRFDKGDVIAGYKEIYDRMFR
jgi:phosphoribosylaminoimidazole-succinocarboxamide synthase